MSSACLRRIVYGIFMEAIPVSAIGQSDQRGLSAATSKHLFERRALNLRLPTWNLSDHAMRLMLGKKRFALQGGLAL